MENMNPEKFKSRMHSLAYGQAMAAAARDYQKEMLASASAAPDTGHRDVDVDDLLDDPELERLHAERLAAMQKEAEKRMILQRKGHGELQEVQEGDFLEVVTTSPRVVCHFFHRDFERCKIIDKHLTVLARKYFDTRFIKLSAPDAPFFTVKLNVKVLPCVVLFSGGVAVDRTVGFDEFGAKDDFSTESVERRLLRSGVLVAPMRSEDDSEDESFVPAEHVRRSVYGGLHDSDDEDSDFD
ncbi:Thioredoxin domain-containing protein 9 [Coccomyxa sp. Obi]|nr:Thioredoxin domain-containing protein 9 [Coccomyxa sp. Obi]